MQIFQENDRSHPAQVVAAQIRTLLYKHEGCTGFLIKSEIEELFCEFCDLSIFVSHLDVILTSSVGPECVELISIECVELISVVCVELISIVQRAISGVSLIYL